MTLPAVLVIIPVRDEAATIVSVISRLQSHGLTHIRVIDNGSRDGSGPIAAGAGAEVFFEPSPGYGQACWRGLQQVPRGVEWILFCDGDGSDDLDQLPHFFAHCGQWDFILGDRTATPQGRSVLTPVQRFGNALATTLIRLGWGKSYRDLGPLRLIRYAMIQRLQMQDRGFGWTVEMQVKAVEKRLLICELPVGYFPRGGGKSKISGTIGGSFQAGMIILGTLAKLYLRKLWRVE